MALFYPSACSEGSLRSNKKLWPEGFDIDKFVDDLKKSEILQKNFENISYTRKFLSHAVDQEGLSSESRTSLFRRISGTHVRSTSSVNLRAPLRPLPQSPPLPPGLSNGIVASIPEAIDARKVGLWEDADNIFESALRDITIASLENAHLSKKEFLEKVMTDHGYTLRNLLKGHCNYKGFWKIYLAAMSAPTIALVFFRGASETDEEEWGQREPPYDEDITVVAKDLELYWKLLSAHLNEQHSEKIRRQKNP